MSSAANHRKRSHRSAAKHYQANRSMRAYASARDTKKFTMETIKDYFFRFFRGFMAKVRGKKGEEST